MFKRDFLAFLRIVDSEKIGGEAFLGELAKTKMTKRDFTFTFANWEHGEEVEKALKACHIGYTSSKVAGYNSIRIEKRNMIY